MGIRDRDYMKRPADQEVDSGLTTDSKAEALLGDFLRRHPRFFLYVGIGLAILIIGGLLAARFL